ncbi:MAG: lipoyl(octanoyl) transferase LipB [Terriglobales bacterium]
MPLPASQVASLRVEHLGRISYAAAEDLQKALVRMRQADAIPDTLLLLEHDPVITLGRNAHAENVLQGSTALAARGITVAECDRGGDVTFHGPGQLVGYPILDLRACPRPAFLPPRAGRLELGPVDYVRALEEVLIRVAAACGVPARRLPGLTGVWTAPRQSMDPAEKFAAIGVHVARGVTSHGFALNVSNDLSGFDCIIPCGIRDHGVTSLARQTGREWDLSGVAARVEREFLAVFARSLVSSPNLWDHKGLQKFLPSEE